MESIHNIQNIIDEYKLCIPDSAYLNISNNMKTLYESQSNNNDDQEYSNQDLIQENDVLIDIIYNRNDLIHILKHNIEHLKYELIYNKKYTDIIEKNLHSLNNILYVTCKCGKTILKTSFNKHKKSKKCIKFHSVLLPT